MPMISCKILALAISLASVAMMAISAMHRAEAANSVAAIVSPGAPGIAKFGATVSNTSWRVMDKGCHRVPSGVSCI